MADREPGQQQAEWPALVGRTREQKHEQHGADGAGDSGAPENSRALPPPTTSTTTATPVDAPEFNPSR